MNDEHEDALNTEFPSLLRMLKRWRFNEVNDGWFRLIFDLFKDIEAEALRIGRKPEDKDWPDLVEVKQGEDCRLHLWIGNTTPEMDELIKAAGAKSGAICEECGDVGRMVVTGEVWRVMCDPCATKRINEINARIKRYQERLKHERQ